MLKFGQIKSKTDRVVKFGLKQTSAQIWTDSNQNRQSDKIWTKTETVLKFGPKQTELLAFKSPHPHLFICLNIEGFKLRINPTGATPGW